MPPVLRLVLDVLKPHDPDIVTLARHVADAESVSGVNATLVETDREVQNIKLTVEGEDLHPAAVEDLAEDLGATVHSIDEVVCGDRLVEEVTTPQDARS